MPRYAAKPDLNHGEIRDGLRQIGFLVSDTARMGEDFPDLVVKHPSRPEVGVRLVEIKSKRGRLTKGQSVFKGMWGESVIEARSIEDVLKVYGLI